MREEDVKLRADVPDLITRAQAGDVVAWGRLYGMASAIIRGGRRVPEPLGQVVAERLNALSRTLMSPPKDVRAALPDAVVPGVRARKPRSERGRILLLLAEAARDLLELDQRHGQRKIVLAALSERYQVPLDSVSKELDKMRRKRTAEKLRETSP